MSQRVKFECDITFFYAFIQHDVALLKLIIIKLDRLQPFKHIKISCSSFNMKLFFDFSMSWMKMVKDAHH